MPKANREYDNFSKRADQSFGHQAGALTPEENEELSRKKFYDAERDYYERGEDKEEFKMYNPADHALNEQIEQQNQEQEITPEERLSQVDQELINETDPDKMQDLINERLELSEEINRQQEQERAREQDRELEYDR